MGESFNIYEFIDTMIMHDFIPPSVLCSDWHLEVLLYYKTKNGVELKEADKTVATASKIANIFFI